MKFTGIALSFCLISISDAKKNAKRFRSKKNAVCFLGCTPYVNPTDPLKGINKYIALVDDMADNCDLIMHIGDTKAGSAACMKGLMTDPLHILVDAAKAKGVAVMYGIGDNEMNDCHRDGSKSVPRYADFYKAEDARRFVLDDMGMNLTVNFDRDVTGVFAAEGHKKNGTIPGTSKPYSCDFDKLMVTEDAVVISLEIPGSNWFLADQTKSGYPNQNTVDPLADRLSMYLNAKDCALEWISYAAKKATAMGKKAVFIGFQAHFWSIDAYGGVYGPMPGASDGIGEYYNATNLAAITLALTGTAISEAFKPLYDHVAATAKAFPNLLIYTVNSDSHTWTEVRANSGLNNAGTTINYNHNWMIHQIEGDSRGLTMYTKISVDASAFEPVQVNQVWSKKAFDTIPVGHTYYKYV